MRGIGRIRDVLTRRRAPRPLAGPELIRAFAATYPEAFFVEIGANDGIKHDHLRPYILSSAWRGVMVEPVPYLFERLQANYAGIDRIAFENVAIADRDGDLPFYYVVDASQDERESLPEWYDGIGSFSREKLLAHGKDIPDIADRIVAEDVKAVTFESLCRRQGQSEVNLVLIDAEGYDAEILRNIDFSVRRPRLLIYEHFHLPPAERTACRSMLAAAGYQTMEEGFDTFCVVPGDGDELDRCWGGVAPGLPALYVEDEEK